jgi:hypothetical protein
MRKTLMSSLCLCLFAGCNLLTGPVTPPKPDDKAPDASVVEKYTEQDYWDAVAKFTESDVFNNTDELCAAVDRMVKAGFIKDASRLAEVRKKRIEPIKAIDKDRIVFILRGK